MFVILMRIVSIRMALLLVPVKTALLAQDIIVLVSITNLMMYMYPNNETH